MGAGAGVSGGLEGGFSTAENVNQLTGHVFNYSGDVGLGLDFGGEFFTSPTNASIFGGALVVGTGAGVSGIAEALTSSVYSFNLFKFVLSIASCYF